MFDEFEQLLFILTGRSYSLGFLDGFCFLLGSPTEAKIAIVASWMLDRLTNDHASSQHRASGLPTLCLFLLRFVILMILISD